MTEHLQLSFQDNVPNAPANIHFNSVSTHGVAIGTVMVTLPAATLAESLVAHAGAKI